MNMSAFGVKRHKPWIFRTAAVGSLLIAWPAVGDLTPFEDFPPQSYPDRRAIKSGSRPAVSNALPRLELKVPPPADSKHLIGKSGAGADSPYHQKSLLTHLRNANRYIGERNWELAKNELAKALEYQPGHPYLMRKAAAISSLAGSYSEAEAYFRALVERDPGEVRNVVGWASVLVRLSRIDEAEEVLDRGLAIESDDLFLNYYRSMIRVIKGEDAREAAWRLLSLNEAEMVANWLVVDRHELRTFLPPDRFNGFCSSVLGKDTESHLEKVLYRMRALREVSDTGAWDQIKPVILELKELGLNLVALEMNLAECYLQMGEFESAVILMENLVLRFPEEPVIWYNYGYTLMRAGKFDRATRAFTVAVNRVPTYGQALFALACAQAAGGDLDKAWNVLSDLAHTHPEQLPAWMEGETPYLKTIRSDERYADLQSLLADKRSH